MAVLSREDLLHGADSIEGGLYVGVLLVVQVALLLLLLLVTLLLLLIRDCVRRWCQGHLIPVVALSEAVDGVEATSTTTTAATTATSPTL